MGPSSQSKQYAKNLVIAAVVSQVGCLTIVVVVGALLMGLWVDAQLGTRPWGTVVMLLLSVPVTLILMFWIVGRLTRGLRPVPSILKEEAKRGYDQPS